MTIVGAEKRSLEDALTHYGVVGVKWGHRKQAGGREIRRARSRLQGKLSELQEAGERVRDNPKGSKERAKAQTEFKKMQLDYLKNPDRVIAHRMTRGEKAAAIILLTPAGAAAAIGTSSAISRRIEQKQDTGKYRSK